MPDKIIAYLRMVPIFIASSTQIKMSWGEAQILIYNNQSRSKHGLPGFVGDLDEMNTTLHLGTF